MKKILKLKSLLVVVLLISSTLNWAQGPILDLSFDEVAVDNSPNGASICGPVRFGVDRFGEAGKSAIFHPNHYDNLIVEAGSVDIQIAGPLTYSIWLKTILRGTTEYVFTSADSARTHGGVTLAIDANGNPAIQLSDGNGGGSANRRTYTAAGSIPSNQWTNIVFTILPGEGPEIYIDGIPQAVGSPVGGNVSNTIRHTKAPFKIGQKWDIFYVGGIDDLKLYDRILSLQEIIDIANNVSDASTPVSSLLKVYPNLTRDYITIDLDESIDQDFVTIINAHGKQLPVSFLGNATVDVKALPAGNYFISYSSPEKKWVSKFVKL